MPNRKTWTIPLAACAAALAHLAQPSVAEACGGTFCDAGPQVMPVDQTGENILFVVGEESVEAHVQIQYEGNPEQFAWVVPVMAVPEVEIGSDPLFNNLLAASVPTFILDTQTDDNCFDDSGGGFGCGVADLAVSADGQFAGEEQNDEPTVLVHDTVGAFEYSVLEGGTVEGVTRWLDDNGYAQDDDAPPILGEYLNEGFSFVAFKLVAGAGVDEIHPVILRTPGGEPCVPIRLTRIAAKEDMGIRTFFLGDGRVVPTNYQHVEINPLHIDWINLGSNYEDVVTRAVDEPGSDGRGFVTEYAGTSQIVSPAGIHSTAWNSAAYAEIGPDQLSDVLRTQGLFDCVSSEFGCEFTHPLVQGLLETYLPGPVGVSAEEFYACTDCYAEQIDLDRWQPTEFAAALEERVIGPAEHSLDLLQEPYLTRMYTKMSPHEMTTDPLFHTRSDLPDISNIYSATRFIDCEGPDSIMLDDGREIVFDEDDVPPPFEDMPYSAVIEQIPEQGAPIITADTREAINAMLEDWNDDHRLASGCDCRITRRSFEGSATLMLMMLLGLRARRRRD